MHKNWAIPYCIAILTCSSLFAWYRSQVTSSVTPALDYVRLETDDLLIGNPYHQQGKYQGPTNSGDTTIVRPRASQPMDTRAKAVPVDAPSKAFQSEPLRSPGEPAGPSSSSSRATKSPASRSDVAPLDVRPREQQVRDMGDELLRGNPYHTFPNSGPRSNVTKPAAVRQLAPERRQRDRGRAEVLPAPTPQSEPTRDQRSPSDGMQDELLLNNPYHDGDPSPLPPQDEVNASNATSSVLTESDTRRDIVGEKIDPRQIGGEQPSTTSEEVGEAAPVDAAPVDSGSEGLFGDLYEGISDDKEEKQQKREERGEDALSAKEQRELDPHYEIFAKEMYPSAKTCAKCHEQIYNEWAVSSHAYAAISPTFHRFEQRLNELSVGSVGYFCLRCHSPVSTAMKIPREQPILEQIPAAYEGVTCIVCHRVNERYTRVNGERRIEPGSIFHPMYGSSDGSGLHHVISKKDYYKVKTSPDEEGKQGQDIHTESRFFDQLNKSEFCVSCHQVAVVPGIKLEVVWEQYRASPACKDGISCQDCHMGKVPGKPLGYATAPCAVVDGKPVNPQRRHSNHMFYGPGYSVAHPGIFPFNLKADELKWTPAQWLEFDYRAGWGDEDFEKAVEDKQVDVCFPDAWSDAEDRREGWKLIKENFETMALEKSVRKQLMESSFQVDGPFFEKRPRCGKPLRFRYDISNLSSGHNAPSGSLGAQPQIWVNTVLINPQGMRVWESGYTDSLGDVADTLSLDVQAKYCPPDLQLVNFQSKFLFTGVKGTDREWFLPVNIDIDQLPFLRPSGFPITTLNHPPTIRMEQRSLPPLSTRKAKYRVPAKAMSMPGKYRLSVRLRSRSHPIYFIRFIKGTPDLERRVNEGMLDFKENSVEFIVH